VQRSTWCAHLSKRNILEVALLAKGVMIYSKTAMKFGIRFSLFVLVLATVSAVAASPSKAAAPTSIPQFPGSLVNAKYVYVTSYDGDQFDINLLPGDREAISTVQNAIQSWGKFTIVYAPRQADIVLMVTSRPSEDLLAVYDGHGWSANSQYLWRMMGRNGLQKGEAPLVANLQKAFEAATASK
jgi:hypothetical protein